MAIAPRLALGPTSAGGPLAARRSGMSASGHDEDNRVDAVCDDIRRVASAPSEPPGAGAVLPGRVAASLRCRVLAMPRGHVEFGLRCLQYVVHAQGASASGQSNLVVGVSAGCCCPICHGGLQLAFTARVDVRPLTTHSLCPGRRRRCSGRASAKRA